MNFKASDFPQLRPPSTPPRKARGTGRVGRRKSAYSAAKCAETFTTELVVTTLDIQTVNPLNRRDHWAAKAKRAEYERNLASTHLAYRTRPPLPVLVTLTRIGRQMDDEGVVASFKSIRDGVADAYGTDDSPSSPIKFEYAQERGPYSVRIKIEPLAAGGGR